MKNTEKLYIAKEAGLRAAGGKLSNLGNSILGSRGQIGRIRKSPGGITRSTPYEPTLWGAKGLKGLTRPKLKQLKNAPFKEQRGYHGEPGVTFGYTNTLKNPMVDTPLAKLLKALAVVGVGSGVGYAGYKGLEADDAVDPQYGPGWSE